MNKTKTIIITVFVVVLAAIGVTTAVLLNNQSSQNNNQQQNSQQSQAPAESDRLVSFTAEPNKTVLEQLKTHAEVVTKESSIGVYVDSINGVTGGTDGKYWLYYVDGQAATVGVSEYITKGGEQVEWRFE